jgi:hypothetical protein
MEVANVGVLHPVVVNDEAKMNVVSDVGEEARLSLAIAVVFEKLDHALVGVYVVQLTGNQVKCGLLARNKIPYPCCPFGGKAQCQDPKGVQG